MKAKSRNRVGEGVSLFHKLNSQLHRALKNVFIWLKYCALFCLFLMLVGNTEDIDSRLLWESLPFTKVGNKAMVTPHTLFVAG